MSIIDEIKAQLELLNRQVELLRQDIQRNYLPRSDFQRRRRQFLLTLALVVVLLVAGGWFTQQMTLAAEHRVVTECFLRPGRLGPAGIERCTATFGRDYADLQAQSAQATAVFVDLQQRVKQLEAQGKNR